MKTIIEQKDGNSEQYDDAFPSFDVEDQTMTLIDSKSNVLGDDVPLALIRRVIFENGD